MGHRTKCKSSTSFYKKTQKKSFATWGMVMVSEDKESNNHKRNDKIKFIKINTSAQATDWKEISTKYI